MFNNLSTDCSKDSNSRTPYGIVVLEQFEKLEDFASKVEQLAYNKLYKIYTDQPYKQCSIEDNVEYPDYFDRLRNIHISIYNSLLHIENVLEGVEL